MCKVVGTEKANGWMIKEKIKKSVVWWDGEKRDNGEKKRRKTFTGKGGGGEKNNVPFRAERGTSINCGKKMKRKELK